MTSCVCFTTELTTPEGVKNGEEAEECLYHEKFRPRYLPALVLVPVLLPLFFNYNVKVTDKRLSFGFSYGVVSKTVKRSDILAAVPLMTVKAFREYGGFGIRSRLGPKGYWETGYIVSDGLAVRLLVRNGNKKITTYVFSCADPERVCQILEPPQMHAQKPWA